MLTSINDVLKPYEDSQPNNLSMNSKLIERIPNIVDPNTGCVTEEFQTFYNNIVECITSINWSRLYEFSDKCMTESQFMHSIKSKIEPVWESFLDVPDNARGLDIELNLQRFQEKHRNIIGGFYVMIYFLKDVDNDISDEPDKCLNEYFTEILFTYKNNKFVVVSKLNAFESI